MDDDEQTLAYAQADFSAPHQQFIEHLKEKFPTLSGTVVDLGCGPADISIRCARNFVGSRVIGIDGSASMLKLANSAIRAHGLQGLIQLQCLRLPCPLAIQADGIISNSLLHHLHQPEVLWQSIHAMAKPNCKIFIMDLMRPDHEATARDLVQTYAANEADILQRDFYFSLLAAFQPDEIRQQLVQAKLPLKVEVISDRHLIIYGEFSSNN